MGRIKFRDNVPLVNEPKDITVYPSFCRYSRKGGLSDGPWLCENSKGMVAFVSEDMKRRYLKKQFHSMNGMRRTQR